METPYWVIETVTLTGNAKGSAVFQAPATGVFHVKHIRFKSTGDFGLVDIKSSTGYHYVSASESEPIPSDFLASPSGGEQQVGEFDPGLDIGKLETLNVDVVDTSGSANTVQIVIFGSLEV